MIFAVGLSALVLLGWSWAANKYFPTAHPPSAKVENGKQTPLPQPEAQPTATSPKALQSRATALGANPRVRILTPSLQGSINLKGAQIDDLTLLRQRETIAKDSPPVRLLSPLGAPGAYIASFGWTGQANPVPTLDTLWTADKTSLSPGHPVTLSTQTPDGTSYQIRIAVDEGYLFTGQQAVLNTSNQPITVRPIGLVSRAEKSRDPTTWTNHIGPISVFDGKANYKIDYKTLDQDGNQAFNNSSGWLGFTDKYWLTALAPGKSAMSADFRRSPSGGYQADYALAPVVVAPGQTV